MCGPVGRVVKVDGRYAAVVYNNRDRSSSSDVLASCWLLRKDDLMVRRLVGWGGRSWGRVGWDIVRLLYVGDVMRNYMNMLSLYRKLHNMYSVYVYVRMCSVCTVKCHNCFLCVAVLYSDFPGGQAQPLTSLLSGLPKAHCLPSDCKILGLTAHRYGVFVVVSSGNILPVGRVDMLTGKVSDGGKFPDTQTQHLAKQQSCTLYKLVRPHTLVA